MSLVGLALAACNSAYADRVAAEPAANTALVAPAPEPEKAPYQVDLIGENGQFLQAYQHNGRFYVLGAAGQRYTIRVTNPTPRRVEAVVSVDGLDVIDGETADLRKRGYIVPAHGELRVDGFRVSTRQVAAFRFSSVSNSYAGRKGRARNVGVIGVAIFDERAPAEIIVQAPARDLEDEDAGWDGTVSGGTAGGVVGGVVGGEGLHGGRAGNTRGDKLDLGAADAPATKPAPAADPAPAPPRVTRSSGGTRAKRSADRRIRPRSPAREERCCGARPRQRPGLGTQFGERRHSNVSFTRFVRANQTTPVAMAELRYNNADGLRALGIALQPIDTDELHTRETADPFPGNRGFARPPR